MIILFFVFRSALSIRARALLSAFWILGCALTRSALSRSALIPVGAVNVCLFFFIFVYHLVFRPMQKKELALNFLNGFPCTDMVCVCVLRNNIENFGASAKISQLHR